MFTTKNSQTRHFSKAWQIALRRREVEKNNFRATGNLKQAKEFVKMVQNFRFHTEFADFAEVVEHTIFPGDSIIIPLWSFEYCT